MSITASLVKQLRDMTGAGMMDCKAALTETGGNIEEAVDWLRKKGIAKADKKSGRTAAEGLVGVASDDSGAVVVEVNSETDFVARNEAFQELVRNIADAALATDGSVEAVASATYPGASKSIEQAVKDAVEARLAAVGIADTRSAWLSRYDIPSGMSDHPGFVAARCAGSELASPDYTFSPESTSGGSGYCVVGMELHCYSSIIATPADPAQPNLTQVIVTLDPLHSVTVSFSFMVRSIQPFPADEPTP